MICNGIFCEIPRPWSRSQFHLFRRVSFGTDFERSFTEETLKNGVHTYGSMRL